MKLLPYQNDNVDFLFSKKRAILGDEPGLGKTACAVRAGENIYKTINIDVARHRYPGVCQVMVICPSSLKLNWEKEIHAWGNAPQACQVINNSKDVNKIPSLVSNWLILSYDVATKNIENLPTPLVLIFDEAHYLKGTKSKRTKSLLYLFARRANRVWFLTGTPIPNCVADIYNLLACCTYGKMGSYNEFIEKYCYIKKYDLDIITKTGKSKTIEIKTPYGAKNVEELQVVMKDFMIRHTADEVLPQLPGYRETIIPLETKKEPDLAKYEDIILASIAAAEEIPQGKEIATLRREFGLTKVKQAVEFIQTFLEQDIPLLVFCYHKDVVKQIYEGLGGNEDENKKLIFGITGEDSATRRNEFISAFQRELANGIVATIGSLGVGVTLTRAAHCIFVEESWVPAEMEQARGRIRRIGQNNFCNYYYLLSGKLDKKIHDAVKKKQEAIDIILGGEKNVRQHNEVNV